MSEIKLCYVENHERVVRKVRVPALSFSSVIEAAQGLLQDSPQAELVLQYCDHDDDKITIGTDLEFQTSIAEQVRTKKIVGNIFIKIFILERHPEIFCEKQDQNKRCR